MPEQYGAEGVTRPRLGRGHETSLDDAARFFLCERCRAQALICRCCDRGQIYCAGECARLARVERRREVARRYQTSRNGRFAHAARSRRYRARRKIVTHHGSPDTGGEAYVLTASAPARMCTTDTADSLSPPLHTPPAGPSVPAVEPRCHWCSRCCSAFVRREPLRRRRAKRTSPS